jgi:hypothetical protein
VSNHKELSMSRYVQLILATLALVALVACTGGTGGPGVATLDSPDPSGSPGSSPAPSAVTPQDAALAYARCMRENGVDMPDPVVKTGSGGEVMIDQRGGAPVSKDKMAAADKICHHFMAAAAPNGQGPAMSAEDQDKVLAFAKCMRDHGIDMPDPDFSGGGFSIQANGGDTNTSSTGSKGPLDDPKFKAANDACSSLLPGRMGQPGFNSDNGSGPDSSPVNQ